ncbi:hypothetical protein Tco_0462708 [Tanacetum coccineum]
MVQPVLYDGDEILKTHHVLVSVTSSEEDLEIAEITRQKMNEKINDPMCVEKKIKIIPPNYSKENFLATFTPQIQLTPEQVFCSKDLLKQKAEDLKTNAPPLPILPHATVYPPNTPVHLKVRAMKAFFENMEAEVDQNVIDKKCGEIERKNLLITNENLITNCISQDVFYTVTDSALTASRFHDLFNAYNVAMTRAIAHLNLQLKHQHLKDNIENFKYKSSKDVPEFDAFFELGKRDDQIQGHKNTIFKLKAQISQLKANKSDEIRNFDYKSLYSQNLQLPKTVTDLQEQLEHFKAKMKRTTSLQTEIENLKTQLKGKMPCITTNVESPKVSVFEKYANDVESIPPNQRNNRDVHHHYLNRLRDTLDTLCEIVEDAKSKRPSDHSLDYA